jgi:hypothetical protein
MYQQIVHALVVNHVDSIWLKVGLDVKVWTTWKRFLGHVEAFPNDSFCVSKQPLLVHWLDFSSIHFKSC